MQDAWRAYLQLALGLTEASKKRAQKVAKKLIGTSGVSAGQVQAFVEELASTSAANREALTKLIRFEVDRALGAVGLATAEEVADLTERVRELERELRDARATAARAAAATAEPLDGLPTKPGAALAESVVTADAPAGMVTGTARPGKAAAKKAVAKKAVAKKAVAKKTVAKKAVAKKAEGLPEAGRTAPPGAEP